ncbi:MAG: penicillin acylase family protein, partial [Longimicrobiales bacterium]
LSLEEVIRLKHSMRMLLADRVKADLIAAVRQTQPTGEVAAAIDLLDAWDNSAAAESRGGLLFDVWWSRYSSQMNDRSPYREPWSAERPVETPSGIADGAVAAEAFAWAVTEARRRYGAWDLPWGDIHRVRRGDVDMPVGGCSGNLGCFRVLNFRNAPDGKRIANGGDGWILAVEFTNPPRAYSVLAYGESPKEDSPYHDDQAALFATNQLKEVAFTEDQIRAQLVLNYRPGQEKLTNGRAR